MFGIEVIRNDSMSSDPQDFTDSHTSDNPRNETDCVLHGCLANGATLVARPERHHAQT